MTDFKRLAVFADLHCGHRAGLTPPKYQSAILGDKYHRVQIECWELFANQVKLIQPIDIAVWNGDLVDGKGAASGGTELLTSDMRTQADMAIECMGEVSAPVNRIIRGTPYHTSPGGEDWENVIARETDSPVGDHEWFDVNGIVFDFKHKVGSSEMYKGTPLVKQKIANMMWYMRGESQPNADIIVRSHVHQYFCAGDATFMAYITPALQAAATKFGARQCLFPVDFGFLWFDCYDNGRIVPGWMALQVNSQKARPEKL